MQRAIGMFIKTPQFEAFNSKGRGHAESGG